MHRSGYKSLKPLRVTGYETLKPSCVIGYKTWKLLRVTGYKTLKLLRVYRITNIGNFVCYMIQSIETFVRTKHLNKMSETGRFAFCSRDRYSQIARNTGCVSCTLYLALVVKVHKVTY